MTPSAYVWTILFLHVGVILVVTAYYAFSAALAPRITHRARVRFAQRPWLPMLIGVGFSVPWVIAGLVLMNAPLAPAKFIGVVLSLAWVLLGLIGGAGIAQHIGAPHMNPAREAHLQPSWHDSIRGGLFITLTWVLPLVGWFAMLPLTLATGVGCLFLGLLPMKIEPQRIEPQRHRDTEREIVMAPVAT